MLLFIGRQIEAFRPRGWRYAAVLAIVAGIAANVVLRGESQSSENQRLAGEDPSFQHVAPTRPHEGEVAAGTDLDGLSATTEEPFDEFASASRPQDSDDRIRELLVGEWRTYRDGDRHLEVKADGTATLHVTLEGAWKFVFGEQLRFDVNWSVHNGSLQFETIGGEPANSIDLVTQTYGKHRVQQVLEMTNERMLLDDPDQNEPDHDWKRAGDVTSAGSLSCATRCVQRSCDFRNPKFGAVFR